MIIQMKSSSSLGNALRLLNLFNMDEPEFRLSELAGRMGVGPSTVHRLTMTLVHEGYLARDREDKEISLRVLNSGSRKNDLFLL